ncbi:Lsr2 dimerization domain-containing protein [Streptacidiphilus cavernicola]|uniref:Histone-like nucleoid-structuring protein Lsr2 n=1 Tax=Streptacidiphilus cavernicola TaxID=3342716 RepID=A0ABV6W698_9ACTN
MQMRKRPQSPPEDFDFSALDLGEDTDYGPVDQSVSFGIDGTAYEIDLLTAREAAEFRARLAPYIAVARVVVDAATETSTQELNS